MRVKNFTRVLIAALAFACLLTSAAFARDIRIIVGGNKYDGSYSVGNGCVYLPVRAFCENLGYQVRWDSAARSAIVEQGDCMASFSAEGVGRILGSSMYAPIRALADALGGSVNWEGASSTVTFTLDASEASAKLSSPEPSSAVASYTEDDLLWLARIIYAEARGESMEGKIAVGNVVLARVASSEFPDTVYGVIFDTKYCVQYEPVSNGTIYNTPDEDCIEAARRALEGETIVEGCLYFFNPVKAVSSWISQNRTFVKAIGNHDFYA